MATLVSLIPIVSWITLNAVTGVLLAFPVRYRFYALPILLIPATVSFKTTYHLRGIPGLSDLWGIFTIFGFIHISSLLYIKQWTLRLSTQQANKEVSDTFVTQLDRKSSWIYMYRVATNPRFVRVPYKHVIIPIHHPISQVKSTAIHGKFSIWKIPRLIVKIGILILLNNWLLPTLLGRIPIHIHDFAPSKSISLRRLVNYSSTVNPISSREIVIQSWITITTLWIPTILLESIHTSLAIFFIYILRIDIPEDWPDLFGNPLDVVSVSRFWSIYWHRIHLSAYTDYIQNFILTPLRLLQNNNNNNNNTTTTIKKIITIFSSFMISGIIHQLTTWQLNKNPRCVDYKDLLFFGMNGCVVILESVVVKVVGPWIMREGWGVGGGYEVQQDEKEEEKNNEKKKGLLRQLWDVLVRVMGYIWVMGFFMWVIPKVYYGRIYCMHGGDGGGGG